MEKKHKYHDFYLTETEPEERTGYRVKQVNKDGEIVVESFIPIEGKSWFSDKDYEIVSKSEWDEIGMGESL